MTMIEREVAESIVAAGHGPQIRTVCAAPARYAALVGLTRKGLASSVGRGGNATCHLTDAGLVALGYRIAERPDGGALKGAK